jgi:hypothetical protein
MCPYLHYNKAKYGWLSNEHHDSIAAYLSTTCAIIAEMGVLDDLQSTVSTRRERSLDCAATKTVSLLLEDMRIELLWLIIRGESNEAKKFKLRPYMSKLRSKIV